MSVPTETIKKSPYFLACLKNTGIYEEIGIPILGIRERGKEDFIFNPKPDTIINSETTFVILANKEEVKKLKEFIGG